MGSKKQKSIWRKFSEFELLTYIFDSKRATPLPREVLVNLELPSHATIKPKKGIERPTPYGYIFESNQVLTSKYNLLTFFPKNLLEQFRRIANVFFLVLVVLQFFPRFTTVSPALAALPLIVVLGITAIKDAYEDMKRHQSDRAINRIQVLTLRGSFKNPNLTQARSKSFGIPTFITTFFLQRTLAQEAEDAEQDRSETRKRFWGRRSVKKPVPASPILGDDVKLAPVASATNYGRQEGDDYADERDAGPLRDMAHEVVLARLVPHPFTHYDRPTWVKESWEDLKVGDFVRLRGDESVPADLVVCSTSEEENVCYVETKNLDGETNLKPRTAIQELTHLRTSSSIADARFAIEAEPADVNMFSYNAAVILHDGQLGKDGKMLRVPVNLNTVLLRGTVVRNTDWVIGVVVMTGRDTKIVMNSGITPSKRSKVERQMNPMVFLNLLILGVMCTMCAIVDSSLQKEYTPLGAYWLFRNNTPTDNPEINGIVTFANALIAFQNIVPISLYISIEFVRLLQAYFIFADDDICYRNGTTKRRTVARSWNLSDDLGQIEYVFSDKTGTLTQNVMLFRQCSIGGKVYKGDTDTESANELPNSRKLPQKASSSSNGSEGNELPSTGSSTDEEKKTPILDPNLVPFHDSEMEADLVKRESSQAKDLYAFFSNLALCHTVLVAEEDGVIHYKAQSPDESALVQAAADVGFIFLGRDKNILRLQTPHDAEVVEFELLNVLEFSSFRKRMSVVLRRLHHDDGDLDSLILLTKGADNVIYERLAPGNQTLKKETDKHLEEFANEGLRTLCLAYKPLTEDEYEAWEREYVDATTLIEGRDKELERVAEKLEQNLLLLGATAIEDRLQDGVPEAIADLKRAGLKIWVATGDKLETAIAIGKTCNLLSRDMNLIVIKGGEYGEPNSAYAQMKNALETFFDADGVIETLENQPPDSDTPRNSLHMLNSRNSLQHTRTGVSGVTDIVGQDNGERLGGYGLVIDGSSLRHTFEEDFTKDLLLELSTRCRAVICCRTSPLQKALIVKLVKEGLGAMCLAIGDGANDVSMIQAADIGVGVAGEEGLQAVNSSDYAIGQFKYLNRLLLVHGHWSYYRNSSMIVNFFYKEIIGIGILFFFQFYCAYSATTVYEYTYLLFWNVFWTLLPVIFIGVLDRDIGDRVLVQVPELYRYGREGKLFGLKRFFAYMLDGTYQSAIIYFFILYAYDTTTASLSGFDIQMYEFSTVMAIAAIYAANMYNGLNTHSWTWWVFGGVIIGPILITAYTAVYSAFPPSLIWTYVYGNNLFLWPSAYFWLTSFFTIIVSLLPRYFYRFYKETYYPNDIDLLTWVAKVDPQHDWINDPFMPRPVKEGDIIPSGSGTDRAASSESLPPIFSTVSNNMPLYNRQNSYQLGRVITSQSVTHDMSTGASREGAGRGYGFDQADDILPAQIRRYTSRTSDSASNRSTRPRKGSMRIINELNPFHRTPRQGRDRSGSILSRLTGRKSVIAESPEPSGSAQRTAHPMFLQPPGSASTSPSKKGGKDSALLGDEFDEV